MNSWTAIFVARIIASIFVFAFGLLLATKWSRKVGIKALAAYFALRVLTMAVLVVVVGKVPPDVGAWGQYVQEVMRGGIPCIDFLTPYFMGFNYLLGGAVWLFQSNYGIVFLFALADLLAVVFLFKVMTKLSGVETAKKTLVLYLSNPISFMCCWLGAQDETLVLLFIALYLFFTFVRSSLICRIVTLAATVFFTKILVVFFIGPFLLLRRWKGALSFLVVILLYAGGVYLAGANPFNLNYAASGSVGAQDAVGCVIGGWTLGNVWYWFRSVPEIIHLLLLATVSFVVFACMRPCASGEKELAYVGGMSVLASIFLLMLYPMVYSSYLVPMLPFLLFLIVARKRLKSWSCAIFAGWSFVMAFRDVFLYGVQYGSLHIPASVDFVLAIANGFCLLINLIMLWVSLKLCKELFTSPIEGLGFVFGRT